MDTIIEISNLDLIFTSTNSKVLNGIDLSINKGSIVGLMGPSGCGKSQLAKTILGLHESKTVQLDGQIVYCGKNSCNLLLGMQEKELNKIRGGEIGLILQDPRSSFNPSKKCGEQILETLQNHSVVSDTVGKKLIDDLIGEMRFSDIDKMYNAYPHQLSGGELQRLAIALILINKPSLIIADEITSALDEENENIIIEILKKEVKKLGASLLWISHNLPQTLDLCDFLYIMDKGKIIVEGDKIKIENEKNHLVEAWKNSLYERPKSTFIESTPPLLSISKVFKKYKNQVVLTDFCLEIGSRQRIGVAGKSGKGKSTLARLICEIEKVDSGKILWQKNEERPHLVQMIFQQPTNSFNPKMTLEDSLKEAIALSKNKIQIDEIAKNIGIESQRFKSLPHELSGGELQRIAIYRALLFKPSLLILDEAVTALDSVNKKEILNLLDALYLENEIAYLFISHDLKMADEFCDEVVRM